MTPDEARFILNACSPADLSHPDPTVAEALAVAAGDAGLRAEIDQQQTFDRAVSARLASITPPPALRARILAGRRAQHGRIGTRRRHLLALAAGLAVTASVAGIAWHLLSPRPQPSLAAFRTEAAHYLDREWDHGFDIPGGSAAEVLKALSSHPAAVKVEFPAALRDLPAIGCHLFQWRGHRATLVCVQPGEGAALVHVISVPITALADLPAGVVHTETGHWQSAAWQHGDRAFVAFSSSPLQTLLPPGTPM